MAGIVGDLRDGLGGQLQVVMEIHESGHVLLLLAGARRHPAHRSAIPRAVSMLRASLERRWNSADTPGAA
jgi:hypothetical protein